MLNNYYGKLYKPPYKKPNLTNIFKVKPLSFSSAITTSLAASLSLGSQESITGRNAYIDRTEILSLLYALKNVRHIHIHLYYTILRFWIMPIC